MGCGSGSRTRHPPPSSQQSCGSPRLRRAPNRKSSTASTASDRHERPRISRAALQCCGGDRSQSRTSGTRSSHHSESWLMEMPNMISRSMRGVAPAIQRVPAPPRFDAHAASQFEPAAIGRGLRSRRCRLPIGAGLECPALLASSNPEMGDMSTPGMHAATSDALCGAVLPDNHRRKPGCR